MDRGRSSGVGGSRGLVAGVKAALKPRSHSVKSRLKSQVEEDEEDAARQRTNISDNTTSSKSYRSPKSPFAGWKRSKSKEKTKRDSSAKSKDLKINRQNPSKPCSKSQAERLSAYITDDYSYSSDASEMLRDIQTGQYTSFMNHNEAHDRRLSPNVTHEQPVTVGQYTSFMNHNEAHDQGLLPNITHEQPVVVGQYTSFKNHNEAHDQRLSPNVTHEQPVVVGQYTSFMNHNEAHDQRLSPNVTHEQPVTVGRSWSSSEPYSKEPDDPYSKEMEQCFGDSGYLNLPTGCFGVPCTAYSNSSPESLIGSNDNSFESSVTYGSAEGGYNYNTVNYFQARLTDNINSCKRSISDLERSRMSRSYQNNEPNETESKPVTYSLWAGNLHQRKSQIDELNNYSEGTSCAVRVQGDGSEAQDLDSPEIKVEQEIKVGVGPSPSLGRQSWLKSALTYNLEVPEFPRNEVVVLALGIDQYIEEVFRYLDHSGEGKVHVEDFKALCNVLGLKDNKKDDPKSYMKRCLCMGSTLTLNGSANNSLVNPDTSKINGCPVHLTFAEFHDMLCESFIQGAKTESVIPLKSRRPSNPKLVTSVVQVQRRYDVLDNIAKSLDEVSAGLDAAENRMIAECPANDIVCCKCQQSAIQQQHIDKNSNIALQPVDSEHSFLQKQVLLQQQELQCLREVIEDMRVALQSSDAENLALQVKTLRSGGPSLGSSFHDLSLTDEEDTIDDLVRQLTALSRPVTANERKDTQSANISKLVSSVSKESQTDIDGPNTSQDILNTAFISGDYSIEKELQATYEALQAAREEREATQADLQKVVGDLQERERDLRGAELSLKAAHTALEKVQYDNQALVMEIAETRSHLEETRQKLMETTENLQQAREAIIEKERLLGEAHTKLSKIRNSRERVVDCVCSARNLVAGSLDQVRAGEQALNSLVALSAFSFQNESHLYCKPQRLDTYCRADSGLYSEESEREEDRRTPDRSTGHNSASEDDLWLPSKSKDNLNKESLHRTTQGIHGSRSHSCSPNSQSSSPSECSLQARLTSPLVTTHVEESTAQGHYNKRANGLSANSTEIIEGLEEELRTLQQTLDEAELEWKKETKPYLPRTTAQKAKEEALLIEEEMREVEAERMRLALIEEKLRQLLQVLLSVADLNLSRRTLGRLVLEAVEDAAGIKLGEMGFGTSANQDGKVSPLTFLTNLLSSTTNYHALSTESLMHLAFQGLSFPPSIPELPEPIEATLG